MNAFYGLGFLLRMVDAITKPIQRLFPDAEFSWKSTIFGFKIPIPVRQTSILPFAQKPEERLPTYDKPVVIKVEKPPISEEHKEIVHDLRRVMAETEIRYSTSCIEVFRKRMSDLAKETESKQEIFEKYDKVVVIDASVREETAAAAAVILRKDQMEPEVRIFMGKYLNSLEAECIPMLHFLKEPNQRILIVTDQLPLLQANLKGKAKNPVMNAVLLELEQSPKSKLSWVPSRHYSPYKICHFLAGFITYTSVSSTEAATEEAQEKMAHKFKKLNISDTFCSLLQFLQTGNQINDYTFRLFID